MARGEDQSAQYDIQQLGAINLCEEPPGRCHQTHPCTANADQQWEPVSIRLFTQIGKGEDKDDNKHFHLKWVTFKGAVLTDSPSITMEEEAEQGRTTAMAEEEAEDELLEPEVLSTAATVDLPLQLCLVWSSSN